MTDELNCKIVVAKAMATSQNHQRDLCWAKIWFELSVTLFCIYIFTFKTLSGGE